jgi:hypothetical protein
MPKKNAYEVHETFKSFIQKTKFERERRRCVQIVELDDTLDHCIWNGINIVQYKVILGYCEQTTNIVPKKNTQLMWISLMVIITKTLDMIPSLILTKLSIMWL